MRLLGVIRQLSLSVGGDTYLNIASAGRSYIPRLATFANLTAPPTSAVVSVYRKLGTSHFYVVGDTPMAGPPPWGPGTPVDFIDVPIAADSAGHILTPLTLYVTVENAEPAQTAVDLYLWGDAL